MNTTIGERFAQLIEALSLTTNGFASSLGKAYTSIKIILDGSSKPGYELLEKVLSTYPNISPDWLMKGEGEMFRLMEGRSVEPTRQDDYLLDHLKRMEDSFTKLSNQVEVKDKQIETKDRQIESLQRMLEVALGKFNDVATDRSAIRQLSASTYRVQAA